MLRIETSVIGLNTREKERALVIQDLINKSIDDEIELTADRIAAIQRTADAFAEAADILEDVQARFDAVNQLAEQFGSQAIDAFEGLLDGTKGLNESLADTARLLRRMILEALLLGQGPLATLFGRGGAGGGVGGLLGGLIGNLGQGILGAPGTPIQTRPSAATTSALTTAANFTSVAPFMFEKAPVPEIKIQIDENKMFASRVVEISGPVVVQGISQNNKALPGMLSNRQRRGI